jgi:hypothetical protein
MDISVFGHRVLEPFAFWARFSGFAEEGGNSGCEGGPSFNPEPTATAKDRGQNAVAAGSGLNESRPIVNN